MACAVTEIDRIAPRSERKGARLAVCAAIFVGVAGLLFLFHANRLIVSIDEGILLEAAQRMLRGQRLYLDFFHTSDQSVTGCRNSRFVALE